MTTQKGLGPDSAPYPRPRPRDRGSALFKSLLFVIVYYSLVLLFLMYVALNRVPMVGANEDTIRVARTLSLSCARALSLSLLLAVPPPSTPLVSTKPEYFKKGAETKSF